MASNKITYGDIGRLLHSEGFEPAVENDRNIRFDNPLKQAAIVLPKTPPAARANLLDLELVRRTMVDFGIMSDGDFERWVADPKHHQAA